MKDEGTLDDKVGSIHIVSYNPRNPRVTIPKVVREHYNNFGGNNALGLYLNKEGYYELRKIKIVIEEPVGSDGK